MKYLRFLNKYFWRYKQLFIMGSIFIILSKAFEVIGPGVLRNAIDMVIQNVGLYQQFDGFSMQQLLRGDFRSALLAFILIFLGIAIMKGFFLFLTRQTLIVMSRRIEYDLRNDMYAHYQKLDAAFYKRNNTGDLMSRATEDVNRVRMYLGPAVMYTVNMTFTIIVVLAVMFSVNARLTLYVLIPLPILSLSIYYVNNIINRKSEAIQRRLSGLTTTAQEVYSGIRVVKSYVQEPNWKKHFEEESEGYKEESLGLAKVQALFFPLMTLLTGLSTIIVIFFGGQEVIRGNITPGNIAEFIIYVNMLTWPVTSLGWVASIIQRAAASQKRINEFLETEPVIHSDIEAVEEVQGNVSFSNVTFTYPDTGITALHDINFSIPKGERWALIGRTGSGKSTIADLLLRMYDPSQGEVKLDDKDLQQYSLGSIRQNIGYVPQDVFLFSDTIEQNILFGVNGNARMSAKEAAQYASIDKEIMDFPKAYETLVGERGVTLSGGQKQRISIARALARDPKILVLDDCLSAVDANTEKTIIGNLDRFLAGRTSIIITHRIFALLNFDNILVLEDGRIAEQGKHEELLRKRGIYAELYEKQQLEETNEKI